MKEKCFVMLKPGVLNRRIAGELISRLEKKGLNLIAVKMMRISKELAEKHYGEHRGKSFYDELINYITSAPVIAMVWEAENCVSFVRKLTGATNALEALPGTIRGDFCIHTGLNVIHASDSSENGERETALFFEPHEIFLWEDEYSSKWI